MEFLQDILCYILQKPGVLVVEVEKPGELFHLLFTVFFLSATAVTTYIPNAAANDAM